MGCWTLWSPSMFVESVWWALIMHSWLDTLVLRKRVNLVYHFHFYYKTLQSIPTPKYELISLYTGDLINTINLDTQSRTDPQSNTQTSYPQLPPTPPSSLTRLPLHLSSSLGDRPILSSHQLLLISLTQSLNSSLCSSHSAFPLTDPLPSITRILASHSARVHRSTPGVFGDDVSDGKLLIELRLVLEEEAEVVGKCG